MVIIKEIVLFYFFICIFFVLIGCGQNKDKCETSSRPIDFPDVFCPPENAFGIHYASPESSRIAQGTYRISYEVTEEYPAIGTIHNILDAMQSKKYVRVQWKAEDFIVSKLNHKDEVQDYFCHPKDTELVREIIMNASGFNQSAGGQWSDPEPLKERPGWLSRIWSGEWIASNDDLVVVLLTYAYPKGQEEGGRLFVNIYIHTSLSERHDYVRKYKELHPGKFLRQGDETQ